MRRFASVFQRHKVLSLLSDLPWGHLRWGSYVLLESRGSNVCGKLLFFQELIYFVAGEISLTGESVTTVRNVFDTEAAVVTET